MGILVTQHRVVRPLPERDASDHGEFCPTPWPVSPSASFWEPPLIRLLYVKRGPKSRARTQSHTASQRRVGAGAWVSGLSATYSLPALALGLRVAAPSDPERCSQVRPCYHKLLGAPALATRAGLLRIRLPGWRGSPSGASHTTAWQEDDWAKLGSWKVPELLQGKASAIQHLPQGCCHHTQADTGPGQRTLGAGGGGAVVWKAVPGRRKGTGIVRGFFPVWRPVSGYPPLLLSPTDVPGLHGFHKASLLINFGLMTPQRGNLEPVAWSILWDLVT